MRINSLTRAQGPPPRAHAGGNERSGIASRRPTTHRGGGSSPPTFKHRNLHTDLLLWPYCAHNVPTAISKPPPRMNNGFVATSSQALLWQARQIKNPTPTPANTPPKYCRENLDDINVFLPLRRAMAATVLINEDFSVYPVSSVHIPGFRFHSFIKLLLA